MTSRGTSYELAARTTKTYDVPADGPGGRPAPQPETAAANWAL